ncbi:MAG: hypothetical protein ACI8UO_000640 [Verrucomicrobiales bacterium]|jgi:hypothetical protein
MKSRLIILAILFSASAIARAQDEVALPQDTLDLLGKLQEFEAAERDKFDTSVAEKRKAVAAALLHHLERETKAGKLETAVALKKLIQELEQNTLTLKLPAAAGAGDFEEWVRSIEIHDQAGWWEVADNQLIQHIGESGIRRFPCKIDGAKSLVSFAANGRTYFFKFLPDRTQGIRSADDDWPSDLFSVKPQR